MVASGTPSSESTPAQAPTPTTQQPLRVAIVSCSSRQPRMNPHITAYIMELIQAHDPTYTTNNITLTHIDLGNSEYSLPLETSEPQVPAQLPRDNPTPHYTSARTRAWSTTIQSFDAFVFVTPQYNWSYPATLKNALDLVFWEWRGKAAAVVTYGTRGGTRAADHIGRVLEGGLRMKLVGGMEGKGMPAVVIDEKALEEAFETGRLAEGARNAAVENGLPDKVAVMWEELKRLATTKA